MKNNHAYKHLIRYSILTTMLLGQLSFLLGQPKQSSERKLEGVTFYQDLKNESLFYYAPGALRLAKETNGAPKIQLVFTRYTGTKCGGDQGEKQFLNIVQFSVVMQRIEAKQLRAAKLALGEGVNIRPLAIQNVESHLIVPVGDTYQRLGGVGSSEANGQTGTSSKRNFWTERTFTLRLANDEAQLLQNLLKDDKLAMSINYAFYADLIADVQSSLDISGTDSSQVDKLQKEMDKLVAIDSIPVLQAIAGGAIPISLDVAKYPEKLKKIDINEAGIPTDYPALEVRCYDFADDLRPDLNMKEIQIKALGIGGRTWVEMPPVTFSRFQADLNVQQVKFKQAVKMGMDFRYRIIDHPKDGEPIYAGWQTMSFCSGIVDATTDLESMNLKKRLLDIEVPMEQFGQKGIEAMTLVLDYQFRGRDLKQYVVFSSETQTAFRQLSFLQDTGSELSYQIVWHYDPENGKLSNRNKLEADYIYCKMPTN